MKPKMELILTDDNYRLIEMASNILIANGMKREAIEIYQRASIRGYRFESVLKLLKEYMDI